MRSLIGAAIATIALSFAAMAFAFPSKSSSSGRGLENDYYYKSYDYAYQPICVARKVRGDGENRPVVRKVRSCR